MTARSLLLVAAASTVVGLLGIFGAPGPASLIAAVVAFFALSAWRPEDGLVALMAMAPVGAILSILTATPQSWTLPLAGAVAAGSSVRLAAERRDLDRIWIAAIGAWTTLILASLIALLLEDAPGHGAGYWRDVALWLAHRFPLSDVTLHPGVWMAMAAIACAQLAVAASEMARRTPDFVPRLLRAALAGGTAVGALNVYRLVEIALRHPPFAAALVEGVRAYRINVAFGDINAAGAFCVMLLPLAVHGLRRPGLRVWSVIALPSLLAGLWLSGSRTALVLVPLAFGAQWWLNARDTTRRAVRTRQLAVAAVVAIVALGVVLAHPRAAESFGDDNALGVRSEMALTTWRMVRTAPIFGVGIGQYFARSPEFMSGRMRDWYDAQNAHNQFLQIAGELGLVGLAIFVLLLALALGPVARAIWRGTARGDVVPVVVGLGVFLVASLTMHPLLVPEVAVGFWLLLGVARASTTTQSSAPWIERAVAIWVVLVALSIPLRVWL